MSLERRRITVKDKNKKVIEDILFGDHDTSKRAKMSFNMTLLRAQKTDPAEARALMKLKKKIRF